MKTMENGVVRDMTDDEIDSVMSISSIEAFPPYVVSVNSIDFWSRITENEAELVMIEMKNQPFRTRKIFETAKSFREDHELWPLLSGLANALFGENRAKEILAPSE